MIEPYDLVTSLKEPTSYIWKVDHVEQIETHISRVFLAGEYVVKIKRPVDFGFVNLTRLEHRADACASEIRLNRRLTSDVYLRRIPIRQFRGRIIVDGKEGEIVEWATLMRRLPAGRMLDHLIHSDSAPPDTVDRLAAALLPFHTITAPNCDLPGEAVLTVVTDNLAQIQQLAHDHIDPAHVDLIASAMERFITEQADLLSDRADNWIREGHGDLRCEHICFETDQRVQIFDCVEFSRDLRCADIASDLAFLLMDLRRLQRPDLADELLARYRDADIDLPDPILRFYATHRALVRAKISILEARMLATEAHQRVVAEAIDYLHLASSTALPATRCIVAVSGLSGTGKTTIAQAISRALGAELHSSDAVRKSLLDHDPNERLSSRWRTGIYAPEITSRTYAELRDRARRSIAAGNPAILDATWLDAAERIALGQLATDLQVPLVFVETTCSQETALRRIRQRSKQANRMSDADASIYRRQRACLAASPLAPIEDAIHVTIDTSHDGPTSPLPLLQELLDQGILHQTPADPTITR